jgi:hypothetical protein
MGEETILSDGTVLVTRSRLVVGATTYAMSTVSSVSMAEEPADRAWWVVLAAVGASIVALCLWAALTRFEWGVAFGGAFGLAMTAAGVALFRTTKPVYHLTVITNGGLSRVLSSQDMRRVSTISAAITMAIMERK